METRAQPSASPGRMPGPPQAWRGSGMVITTPAHGHLET